MRKNKTMRIASLLLVAVLMTTCIISGTYAKYVTTGEVSDTARVAKFGVEVTANSDLFATTYAKHDSTYSGTLSVVSSDTDKVVAPGTSGDIAAAGLTGTPEVAVRVSYENVDFEIGDNWVVGEDDDFYCPLVITVNSTEIKGLNYTAAADFEAAVETAIKGVKADFAANTDLSTATTGSVKVAWSWPFSTSATNDVADTELGDAAADGNAATVSLKYDVTVTQID